MRTWAIIATVAVIAIVSGVVGGFAMLFHGGMGARAEPSTIEAALASKARRFGLRGFRDQPNPITLNDDVIAEGRAHFADHCADCHANDGSGQTEMGQHLYPRAPDLRLSGTQGLTDGELFGIIEDGVRFTGMPGWGDKSEESQRASWLLVHFIRHLPRLAPEEKLEMEALNPRGPEEMQEDMQDEKFLNGEEVPPVEKDLRHHHH